MKNGHQKIWEILAFGVLIQACTSTGTRTAKLPQFSINCRICRRQWSSSDMPNYGVWGPKITSVFCGSSCHTWQWNSVFCENAVVVATLKRAGMLASVDTQDRQPIVNRCNVTISNIGCHGYSRSGVIRQQRPRHSSAIWQARRRTVEMHGHARYHISPDVFYASASFHQF